tara:strand:+ start:199 stop:345 length:147 start_codon:yes stop_codon:yes gene_type:complete
MLKVNFTDPAIAGKLMVTVELTGDASLNAISYALVEGVPGAPVPTRVI